MIQVRVRRKPAAIIDPDHRCVLTPAECDWDAVASKIETMQAKGRLGPQKILVVRDGEPLLLNGWSRVVTEQDITQLEG